MMSTLIDKVSAWLPKFSEWVGESTGIDLHSRSDARLAAMSTRLNLPSVRALLPYEAMDETDVFINKQSVGFGLHVQPAQGADEALVKSMAELIKNKLHPGVDCTIILHKHPYVGAKLRHGFEPMLARGGIYARLAQMSLSYHLKAVKSGYNNARNLPVQLADYRVYLFFSTKQSPHAIDAMRLCRDNIESDLSVAGLYHARLKRADFITWMHTLLAPNLGAHEWPDVFDAPDTALNELMGRGNSLFSINDLSLDIHSSDEVGTPVSTRVINCQIERWPEQMALWQTPDLFANLLRPEHGIPCSFLISFTVRGVNQTQMMSKARGRAKSLNANANAIQLFLNPSAREEGAAWNAIHEEGSRDNLSLLPTFYNVMLFTNEKDEREMVAASIAAFRQVGFTLAQSRATQWVRFLASLPFFMTEGFFDDLSLMGATKLMTHMSVANLMPLVADSKGSPQGMLLPTYRHQLSFFDPFDNKSRPITNFNFLTVGSPGAGKSMFQQALLFSGLALGEITYVIDLGNSYKHLCELVGGTYVDVSKMTLNPFTLFDFEGHTEIEHNGRTMEVEDSIQIRDLLAIMASPHTPVCDVQKSYLLDATRVCWQKVGRRAGMDDVLEALRERLSVGESKDDPRLNDLIILLKQYGRDGVYGAMFHGETVLFNQSKFVVFEMGALESNPDLLTIVMFVMIVIIQGQFYQTDRSIRKRCIIDEAWRFLTASSNPIAANFIEQGFRCARKHNGGFGVSTQYLADTEKTTQGQAIAASSDTKIIMRQGNFNDYVSKNPTRFTPLQEAMVGNFGDVMGSGFSNVMIEAGNMVSFHRYFADPFSRVLFSSTGVEFAAIEAKVLAGMSLEEAVADVAHEFYGEAG